jgi:phosphatidylglycerophosphate synthase
MAPPGESTTLLAGVRDGGEFPFVTPLGDIPLPWWIVAVVLGRELFMTVFRQVAARRGLVISAIGPAKWKMGFQCTWVGAAYFWFSAATAAEQRGWSGSAWSAFAMFNGIVGTLSMVGAFGLTLASLWLYMRRYGPFVILRRPAPVATPSTRRGPGAG